MAKKNNEPVLDGVEAADDMRLVRIPRGSKNQEPQFVAVNGQNIMIKPGKAVEVESKYADVLNWRDTARERSYQFIEDNLGTGEQ